MSKFTSLAMAIAMAALMSFMGIVSNISVVWAQAQSTPRPATSVATGSAAATLASLPAECREYTSASFTTVRLDREVPVSMVLAASWEGLNAADAAAYLNANFARGGVDLPSRDVLVNRWPTPGDARRLGPQNWVTPGQGGTVRAGVEGLATLRDLLVANRPAPGQLPPFEAHLSSYKLVYVRDGSPPPAKPNNYSVVRRHAWQVGDPPTPQGVQVFEIESSADLAPDYDALSTATLGHTSATPHSALFPNYVSDANRADGTWNTFTVKVRARATLRIPRSHQRSIERACHALPRVPGIIASGSRVAMEDLKDELDGVGTNPAASEELRAAVIAARRAIRNVTDRPLPREVLAVSAANANANGWRQVAEREQRVGLQQRGEAFIAIIFLAADPFNPDSRKSSPFLPVVCVCLLMLAIITVTASIRSHNLHRLFNKTAKQLDGLAKVDQLIAAFAGYVGPGKDPKFAADNPVPAADLHLAEKLGWLIDAFEQLVLTRIAAAPPVLPARATAAPPSNTPIKFIATGGENPVFLGSQADFDRAASLIDAAAFERGANSFVIPSVPVCAAILAHCDSTDTSSSPCPSRELLISYATISSLTARLQDTDDDLTDLVAYLAKHGVIDAQLAELGYVNAAPGIAHQIEQFAAMAAENREALARSQAAEGEMVFHRGVVEAIWPIVFGFPLPDGYKPTTKDIAEIHRAILGRRVETGPMAAIVSGDGSSDDDGPSVLLVHADPIKNWAQRNDGTKTAAWVVPMDLRYAARRTSMPTVMVAAAGDEYVQTSAHPAAIPPDALPTVEAPVADSSILDPHAPVVIAVTKKPLTEGHRSARRASRAVAEAPASAPLAPAEPVTPADFQSRRVTPLSAPTHAAPHTPADRPPFVGSPLITGLRAASPASGVQRRPFETDSAPPASDPSAASDSTG